MIDYLKSETNVVLLALLTCYFGWLSTHGVPWAQQAAHDFAIAAIALMTQHGGKSQP